VGGGGCLIAVHQTPADNRRYIALTPPPCQLDAHLAPAPRGSRCPGCASTSARCPSRHEAQSCAGWTSYSASLMLGDGLCCCTSSRMRLLWERGGQVESSRAQTCQHRQQEPAVAAATQKGESDA